MYCFIACKSKSKYPFAIQDFDTKLQPHLIKLVEKNIVGGESTDEAAWYYLRDKTSIKELRKLTKSEHPILRTYALYFLSDKDTSGQQSLILSHLDDTAIIVDDKGEFGHEFITVTDALIERTFRHQWHDKKLFVDTILTKHNYLLAAYTLLRFIEPEEKYYNHIRKMAMRDREFWQLEYALYALANVLRTRL